jgi:hypothetical protein
VSGVTEETISLRAAAEQSGQSVIGLGRWCATGKLRCERDATGWLIPVGEIPRIVAVARDHANAVEDNRVTAIAVPLPEAPRDLADQVASRLGLSTGNVSLTPLALDGVEYVVAVWRGSVNGSAALPELRALAVELRGELLDGEVKTD